MGASRRDDGGSILAGSTFNAGQTQLAASTAQSHPAIDLNHIRPTTKFDQLTKELQTEIERLDDAILNQIKTANEVPEALLKVDEIGQTIPAAIDLVSGKLDEVEAGLENDAAAIVSLRDGDVKKGEGEAKCVFRAVDRLKVPRQYQVAHKQNDSIIGGVYGGSGLSGWWNNPQTLGGSSRGAGGQTMQLPGEEVDDSGPKSLVELFNGRCADIADAMKSNKALLSEIEGFVAGLEEKVRGKERQLAERLNYGGQNGDTMSEKEQQEQLLRYVFGQVERGIFQTAGKVAGLRDDVLELTRAPR
ncbi:hypothetical protein DV736_g4394, partial [Chaetothyriales sp. CBS 134916]